MIRVLFIIPNFNTAGSGKAVLNLAIGLDKNKFESHIMCKHNKGAFFEDVQKSGIPTHIYDFEPPMRPVTKLIKESIRVSKKINQINPHVIHSFHYGNSYGEALAGKITRAKWIFTKKNMNWGSDGANAWKLRSFLADFIVVQNTKMIDEFYPNSKKIRLIERGIQVELFSEFSDNIDAVYGEMNTPIEARVIVCVANISPVKGVHYLIQAFQALEKDNWHLWLIGDDKSDYAKQLKSDIEMNVENGKNIHFSGKKNDVRPYVKAAEIFVLPTTKTGEGSPVALLEAMAMKKVVLGSRVPGIEDQLKEFEQHMFESENADSLASALHRLLKNTKAKNEELGQDFYNHVSKKYHINREVAQHEKLYTELCSN